jgi:Tol biopolymer transport system component
MRHPTWLIGYVGLALLLLLGCDPERVVVDAVGHAGPSLVSTRYSAWSLPVPLSGVNSASTDQQPALSKDGLSLYFSSNRTGGMGSSDIWVAQRSCTAGPEQCPWGSPQVVPVVNSAFLDVSPSLSRDEHQLFFASQRPHDHCATPSPPQCNNRDLWVSYREDVHDDSGWGEAINLGDAINSSGEEIAPSYFENEAGGIPQLFFNRGAVGGDIYVSELQNGVWSGPAFVTELNTAGTDQRASISPNGLEIWFYSDRDGTNHLWAATRESVTSHWLAPGPVFLFPDGDQTAIMPFLHSQGRTQTLLFVRPFGIESRDLWSSERTRLDRPE